MRKLVESTFVALDGAISDPAAWGAPYWNDEHASYACELLLAADALLFGGVNVTNQLLHAGLVDELPLDVMPLLLGAGLRLFESGSSEVIVLEKIDVQEVGERISLRFRIAK